MGHSAMRPPALLPVVSRPAVSLIVFTTASGAGFGLLALLGVLAVADAMPVAAGFAPVAILLALGLVVGGLVVATRHLGRPARLLLALTQWRSSWLSREGVAAVACIAAALGFAALSTWPQGAGPRIAAGATTALLATACVVCTAMIYASLRPVPQWHRRLVPACFLLVAGMTGALLLVLLADWFGAARPGLIGVAVAAILASWAAKQAYWRQLDRLAASAGPPVAAGLDRIDCLRPLDPPLLAGALALAEMGGGLTRARSRRLRRVAGALLFVLPLALTLAHPLLGGSAAIVAAAAGVGAAGAGVLLERWLFFAEARHISCGWYELSPPEPML